MPANNRRSGLTVLVELPEGWSISFHGDMAIAVHIDHAPKCVSLECISSKPFEEWPELSRVQEIVREIEDLKPNVTS